MLIYNLGQNFKSSIIVYCRIPQLQASYDQQAFNHSTQDRDQALTCCVKMVQQISYFQEMKYLMDQKEATASCIL